MERTLVILKPDAVQRGLVGALIGRLEARGLKVVGMKLIQISDDLARRHYVVHTGKSFFEPLIQFITSGPVVVMVWEGPQAIEVVRASMGATNPAKAAPGTLRADFGVEVERNVIHGSDGPDTARTEIALFFSEDELVSYGRDTDRWIYSPTTLPA